MSRGGGVPRSAATIISGHPAASMQTLAAYEPASNELKWELASEPPTITASLSAMAALWYTANLSAVSVGKRCGRITVTRSPTGGFTSARSHGHTRGEDSD